MESLLQSLSGILPFLAYFLVALGLIAIYAVVYSALTPHPEFTLLRANVPAAALAFGGSLLGFVLPLHSAISHSVSLVDCAVWGMVALAVQLLTFFGLRFVLPGLGERIRSNEIGAGIFVALASVSIGLVNAACMSY